MPQKGAEPKKMWKSEDFSTFTNVWQKFSANYSGAFFRFLQRI
jgi:hypothetical protein